MKIAVDTQRTAWYVRPSGSGWRQAEAGPFSTPEAATKDILDKNIEFDQNGTVPIFQYRVPTPGQVESANRAVQAALDVETNADPFGMSRTSSVMYSAALLLGSVALKPEIWQQSLLLSGSQVALGVGLLGGLALGAGLLLHNGLAKMWGQMHAYKVTKVKEDALKFSGSGWDKAGFLTPTRPDPLSAAHGIRFVPDSGFLSNRQWAADRINRALPPAPGRLPLSLASFDATDTGGHDVTHQIGIG